MINNKEIMSLLETIIKRLDNLEKPTKAKPNLPTSTPTPREPVLTPHSLPTGANDDPTWALEYFTNVFELINQLHNWNNTPIKLENKFTNLFNGIYPNVKNDNLRKGLDSIRNETLGKITELIQSELAVALTVAANDYSSIIGGKIRGNQIENSLREVTKQRSRNKIKNLNYKIESAIDYIDESVELNEFNLMNWPTNGQTYDSVPGRVNDAYLTGQNGEFPPACDGIGLIVEDISSHATNNTGQSGTIDGSRSCTNADGDRARRVSHQPCVYYDTHRAGYELQPPHRVIPSSTPPRGNNELQSPTGLLIGRKHPINKPSKNSEQTTGPRWRSDTLNNTKRKEIQINARKPISKYNSKLDPINKTIRNKIKPTSSKPNRIDNFTF